MINITIDGKFEGTIFMAKNLSEDWIKRFNEELHRLTEMTHPIICINNGKNHSSMICERSDVQWHVRVNLLLVMST